MYSRIKLKTETDVVAPKDLDMCRSQELDPSRPSRAERLRRLGMGWGASMELEKKEKHCCWWKKSCTSWYGQTTIIYMVLSIAGEVAKVDHFGVLRLRMNKTFPVPLHISKR